MKYMSTIIFALCLAWSWNIVHKESSVSFQTHAALQTKLAEIIATTIKQLKPSSDNFAIKTLWTETLSSDQVKAHFTYKFDEVDTAGELVGSEINGEAILQKDVSVANQTQHWTLVNVKTNTGSLNFRDGITITPTAAGKIPQIPTNNPGGTPGTSAPGGAAVAAPGAATPGTNNTENGQINPQQAQLQQQQIPSATIMPTATPVVVPTTHAGEATAPSMPPPQPIQQQPAH